MDNPELKRFLLSLVLGLMGWALVTAPWWSRPLDEIEYHDVPRCVHQGRLL